MFEGETSPTEKGPDGNFNKNFERMVSNMPDIYHEALRSSVGEIEESLKQSLQNAIESGVLTDDDFEGVNEKSVDEIMGVLSVKPEYEEGYIDYKTGAPVFSVQVVAKEGYELASVEVAVESKTKICLKNN